MAGKIETVKVICDGCAHIEDFSGTSIYTNVYFPSRTVQSDEGEHVCSRCKCDQSVEFGKYYCGASTFFGEKHDAYPDSLENTNTNNEIYYKNNKKTA